MEASSRRYSTVFVDVSLCMDILMLVQDWVLRRGHASGIFVLPSTSATCSPKVACGSEIRVSWMWGSLELDNDNMMHSLPPSQE